MNNSILPNGWVCAQYQDIYLSASNGVGGTQNKDGKGLPVSRIETIANESVDYERIGHITIYDEKKVEKHRLMAGDILFSHINSPVHLGKTAIYDGKHQLFHGINLLRIVVDRRLILPSILNYHCKYIRALGDFSAEAQHAVNQSSLNQKKLGSFNIPLPPLAEQKIIADKLDDLLARVECIKTRLENIPEILKKFRQSVLSSAVSGELTEEWRNKYSDSVEVFTELDGMNCFRDIALPKLPKKWKWLRFDQVADIASNLKSPLDYPDAIHIAPNHVESWTGKLSDFQTISQDNVTSAKHEFYPGQIIYSKIRPYLCKVSIAKFGGLCSADMYPINSKIETDYLFRWMLTITFTDWASNAESRSVLPKINQKDLSKVPVPTPPIPEQQEIIRIVQIYLSYADSMQRLVCNGLLRITSLTQSILAKAFRGELTAQWREENPDLISGLNSAEALLEKITAEKLAAGTIKKRAKKTSQ
ncbi:restriction endonuclease subunit S [Rosenbergiella nectarea]|uniref:restriction endonuclease subunit S n=1 Tax=Rosenbergiella nectarea TaxID=988801 RepID=UPI001BDA6736|nr:restriction endonuclease subunit S [Rosenbergiella nectarea]MBT0728604.1 hypothetical protein [Rosenbergiella nectarea subsp. apis]